MQPNASEAWLNCVEDVLTEGSLQSSRNGGCKELINHSMCFDMRFPFVTVRERNINFKYVAAESHWTIMGSNRLDFNPSLQKTLIKWSDTGNHLAGGYGPAFCLQLPYLVSLLRKRPDTRQAVCSIWERNPHFENDMPCMLSLQFLVRDGKLHTVVNMRSSDVWLGLPNDMTVFAMMAACVTIEVGKRWPLGVCYINAGSRHVYDDNYDSCYRVTTFPGYSDTPAFEPEKMNLAQFILYLSQAANAESRADAMEKLTGVRP
jgi:thymidylate synthase